jgi:hypothetical protein
MQDKQKVTLYLPPELHRQLKIRSAVDAEPMSAIAQKAIVFYLQHPELVEEAGETHGKTHQVYSCPECSHPLIVGETKLFSLTNSPSILHEEEVPVESVKVCLDSEQKETLVTC